MANREKDPLSNDQARPASHKAFTDGDLEGFHALSAQESSLGNSMSLEKAINPLGGK